MAKMKTDAQWQAESDAQTLISAEAIKSAPARMQKARVAAKKIAVEAVKAAKSAKRVAGTSKAGTRTSGRRRG